MPFTMPLGGDLSVALREPHGAPAFAALVDANREHLGAWFPWAGTADEAVARRWAVNGLKQLATGEGWHGTLLERGVAVGAIGVHALDRTRGTAELGYWLAEDAQGRGLMTRAVDAVLAHLFVGRGLQKVAVAVDAGNRRSAAVVERAGFRHEGRLRGVSTLPGGRRGDEDRYGLLREEWEGRRDGNLPGCATFPRFRLELGDGVALALLELGDAVPLTALVRDNVERLAPWFPWVEGFSEETTRAFITERALPALIEGKGFETAIAVDGRMVGAFGVHRVDLEIGSGELGYWVGREAEGRGLVSRAARAVTTMLFEERDFTRVVVTADAANLRSRAVPERLGFRHEATLRRTLWNGTAAVDMAVYGLMRDEWRAAAATVGSSPADADPEGDGAADAGPAGAGP